MVVGDGIGTFELCDLLPALRGVREEKPPTGTFRVVGAPHDCGVARDGYRKAELVSRIAFKPAGNGAGALQKGHRPSDGHSGTSVRTRDGCPVRSTVLGAPQRDGTGLRIP